MAPTKQLTLPKITVLVVEVDGPDMIEACSLFEDEGLRVREGYDESDVRQIIERQPINLALIAVKLLYGRDGLSVAALLAEHAIPFVWTYTTQTEQRRIPSDLKDRPTLMKPLDAVALHEAIGQVLGPRAMFDPTGPSWMMRSD